jgi:peptidoglycan/LPS O-acetylase OafA/YrhL
MMTEAHALAITGHRPAARLAYLDAIRGVLACCVLADHAAQLAFHTMALEAIGQPAVLAFFTMSGLVLARSYDHRFGPFLLRRLVRLAPVYVVCWLGACLLNGVDTPWALNHTTWSLHVEAAAMLIFPIFVWAGEGIWRAFFLALAFIGAAALIHPYWVYGAFFAIGSAMRGIPRLAWDGGRLAQWLGRISYSLYLCHWPLLVTFGPWLGVPICFAVAWVIWLTVEQPSITASRRVA